MTSGNVLAVLDLTVLKYLASRGFTESHSALRRALGLDDDQVVGTHHDLMTMFVVYLNGLQKEAHASSNQIAPHALNNSQVNQAQYDNMLMPSDCQGVGQVQGGIDGNAAKRMRAACGHVTMGMSGGYKRKLDARAMQAVPRPYNQSRQLVHFSGHNTFAMEHIRLMQQQKMQLIRQRNGGVSMQGVVSGSPGGVSGANLQTLNGLKQAVAGVSGNGMNAHSHYGIQEPLGGSGTNSGSGHNIPVLSASLSGYPSSGGGSLYGFNVPQTAGSMAGISGIQGNRQGHNTHDLRAMQQGPTSPYGINTPVHVSGRLPNQIPGGLPEPCVQIGSVPANSPGAGYLMNTPGPTPRSLRQVMQLQSVPAAMDMHNNVPCAVPVSSSSQPIKTERQLPGAEGDDPGCRCITGVPALHIPGPEKVPAGCMSSTIKDMSMSGHSRVISADSIPMSHTQQRGNLTTHDLKHHMESNLAMNNSTGNGNSSNAGSGQGTFGNSSSASSTDVNGDLGSAVGHLDTPSSDKDAPELENAPLKEPPLDWESPDVDVGSSAAMLSGVTNDMPPMESLGFDSVHGIDTLEAFLNEPGT